MSRKNRTGRTMVARRRWRKPVLVKAGSVVVKIRQSPLLIKGRKYPSFVVDYYANGKRYRERRNTLRKARALADAVVAKLVKGELQALELTGEDRRIYLLAVENLKELGVGLDAAAREYAEAKNSSAVELSPEFPRAQLFTQQAPDWQKNGGGPHAERCRQGQAHLGALSKACGQSDERYFRRRSKSAFAR